MLDVVIAQYFFETKAALLPHENLAILKLSHVNLFFTRFG